MIIPVFPGKANVQAILWWKDASRHWLFISSNISSSVASNPKYFSQILLYIHQQSGDSDCVKVYFDHPALINIHDCLGASEKRPKSRKQGAKKEGMDRSAVNSLAIALIYMYSSAAIPEKGRKAPCHASCSFRPAIARR